MVITRHQSFSVLYRWAVLSGSSTMQQTKKRQAAWMVAASSYLIEAKGVLGEL
jgi:hypothetical protein